MFVLADERNKSFDIATVFRMKYGIRNHFIDTGVVTIRLARLRGCVYFPLEYTRELTQKFFHMRLLYRNHNRLVESDSWEYSDGMVKKAAKKSVATQRTKKQPTKASKTKSTKVKNFEPEKMTFAVSSLAVISLMLLSALMLS